MASRYPSFEIRRPRATFTKKLEKICAMLDQRASGSIEIKGFFEKRVRDIRIVRLSVFGSYAHGATRCGDLDLLVEIEGPEPSSAELNRQFLGKLPDVSIYIGTPAQNSSGVKIEDAHSIWTPGCNWQATIDAILPDETATRYHRQTDAFVLRAWQTGMGPDRVSNFLEDCARGTYAYTFIPLEALDPTPFEGDPSVAGFRMMDRCGSIQRALMPYACALWDKLGLSFPILNGSGRMWLSKDEKAVLYLGNGRFEYARWLYRTRPPYTIEYVILIPTLNTRGPNGAMVITRGKT